MVLTPATYSYQMRRWTGGHEMPRLVYELWVLRNNARFLRKHGRWLHAQGLAARPSVTMLRFVGGRARMLLAGRVYAIKRLIGRR